MSASLIQPLTFTGVSTYSSDFQTIISRAVQIAQIPVQVLQNRQTNIQQEQTLAASLNSAVAAVASSVSALGGLGSTKALSASSSNSAVATATVTGVPSGLSYNISNVTSLATPASESSLQGYANANSTPVSSTGTLDFTFGNPPVAHTINLGAGQTYTNTLNGLVHAINSLNAGVTASIMNSGGQSYLSVAANDPGANTISLVDDPAGAQTQLLTKQNQGSNTNFTLNGIPVSEPSTDISDVIPGVTLSINGLSAGSQNTTISLNTNPSQISSALQSLVTNYNALAQQVNAQFGKTAGLLNGNSIIWETRNAMMQLVQYSGGSGSVHSLTDLGISMDSSGTMSFDPSALASFSPAQLNDALSFLGSATTGLGAVANNFTALSDPVSGAIQAQLAQFDATNTRLSDQISTATDQINTMQANMQTQLAAADSAISALQSQQTILNASIQSLQYTTFGPNQQNAA